jgi:hypothetical protein
MQSGKQRVILCRCGQLPPKRSVILVNSGVLLSRGGQIADFGSGEPFLRLKSETGTVRIESADEIQASPIALAAFVAGRRDPAVPLPGSKARTKFGVRWVRDLSPAVRDERPMTFRLKSRNVVENRKEPVRDLTPARQRAQFLEKTA